MSNESEESGLNCPICFEMFKEPIIGGNCGHSFCNECVKGCNSNECPLCKEKGQKWIKNFTLASLVNCNEYSRIAFGPDTTKKRRKSKKRSRRSRPRSRPRKPRRNQSGDLRGRRIRDEESLRHLNSIINRVNRE